MTRSTIFNTSFETSEDTNYATINIPEKSYSLGYKNAEDLKRLNFINNQIQSMAGVDKKILDVGCGNGNISLFLGNKGYIVKGIDVSNKAIEIAKSKNIFPHVDFECLPAEELSANGDKYDVVVCSEVLEHLEKPENLLNTLYNLLKEDGKLIVTVPNGWGPRELFITRPVQLIYHRYPGIWNYLNKFKKALKYKGETVQSAADNLEHVQFFTKKVLNKMASNNQFVIEKLGKANFIEAVFPFSLFTKRIKILQKLDCKVADYLPYWCTSGFYMVWKKQ